MDHLRAPLGSSLDWLESRGLTGTVAFSTLRMEPTPPNDVALTQDTALENALAVELPREQTPQADET